jgi:hypothetical protein
MNPGRSTHPRAPRRGAPRANLISWVISSLLALSGCEPPIAPPGDRPPSGPHGPRVRWDPGHTPFPEIPLPNDYAVRVDPTSPTGVRLNASLMAPTFYERNLRVAFDRLDGWGTTMPISVSFEGDLDLADLARRHPIDPSDFTDDAVYVIDLETGVPVPLDLGSGHFPLSRVDPRRPMPSDPRASGDNLLFSTVNEDRNGDGVLQREEDSNHDGELQRAAPVNFTGQTAGHWDAEARALVLRPLVPLRERHRYAVVLTSRLAAASGPVRSPFDTIAHPNQLEPLRPVQRALEDPAMRQRYYGELRWSSQGAPGAHVAFAWMFTTQTTTTDLVDAYRGLRGEGRLRALAAVPPNVRLSRAATPPGSGCPASSTPYVITRAQLQALAADLIPALGFEGPQARALIASFDWVEYAAVITYDSPSLFRELAPGDEETSQWDIDRVASGVTPRADTVQAWVFVPRARPGAQAPFPVALHPHGYSVGNYQALAYAGFFARMGYATITANAPSHGFALNAGQTSAARAFFAGQCLSPLATAALQGRARDVNGDGTVDSGGDFLTAQIFRTRDMVRQTVLDYLQLVRAMRDRSWREPGPDDHNGDGRNDAPGDFNGDGVIDFGGVRADGTPVDMAVWGASLGGVTAGILGAIEPSLSSTTTVSGGGILTDITARSMIGAVQGAVLMPSFGPVIAAMRPEDRAPANGRSRTSCPAGTMSLRFIVPDGTDVGELEFACRADLMPGDDVLVFNEATLQRRCARADENGRLFLPFPSDRGDPVSVKIYRGAAFTNYARCDLREGAVMRTDLRTFTVFEGDCDVSCGHIPPNASEGSPARRGAILRRTPRPPLASPAAGVGLHRQTAAFRRFLHLAQAGLDPGDPINYAPMFSLRPWDGRPRPLLSMTTAGDDIVPVSSGISLARAAGLVPFFSRADGPAHEPYVMPRARAAMYAGATAAQLLAERFVSEGIPGLNRHPVAGSMNLLFDADDLDDGRQGFGEVALTPPLRLARVVASERRAEADPEARWAPREGDAMSAYVNAYIVPGGTHVFLPSDPSQRFDIGLYLTNLVGRYIATQGRDIRYATDPTGHRCLADSSCAFIPRAP